MNNKARRLGVAEGMSRAEMDSFPSVLLFKRSVIDEQGARAIFWECAGRYSPRIETIQTDNAFGCVLDIAGTEKLFGSPQILAGHFYDDLVSLGIHCGISVSHNFDTAVCMARSMGAHENPLIIPAGEERRVLSSLPFSALSISTEQADTFAQWGIATLGALAALTENELIARLGQHGSTLLKLSRGEHRHLFSPVEPVPGLKEYMELDSPIENLDSLLFGASLMIETILFKARGRLVSLAGITCELGLEGGSFHLRKVRPAVPSNDKHLWLKLLHLDLIAHPPHKAVISLCLAAETGSTSKVQLGMFCPQLPEPNRLEVTLARIGAVVGKGRVGSIELKDTHASKSFRIKPFSLTTSGSVKRLVPGFPALSMRCFRPPEIVSVSIRDQHPYMFYFRGIGYRTEKVYGPWRKGSGWWLETHWSIEEWDIIARARDGISGDGISGNTSNDLFCCNMTHDVMSNRWQIEALYD